VPEFEIDVMADHFGGSTRSTNLLLIMSKCPWAWVELRSTPQRQKESTKLHNIEPNSRHTFLPQITVVNSPKIAAVEIVQMIHDVRFCAFERLLPVVRGPVWRDEINREAQYKHHNPNFGRYPSPHLVEL